MKTLKYFLGFTMIAALFLFSGCASTGSQVKQRYFWPPLPDEPKIEWIGAYSSAGDFRLPTMFNMITGEGSDELVIARPLTAVGDGNGKVYVTDTEKVTVFVFDFTKQSVSTLGDSALSGIVKKVNGIALDGSGYVYVSDSVDQKIYVIDPVSDKLIKTLDISKHVKSIGKIAIDKLGGRIIVADFVGHQVAVTDLEGKHLFSFGKPGTGDGEFNFPVAVAIEPGGGIVVADARNARIQRFTSDGKFVNKFGKRGDAGGDFSVIKGVAVDSEGHIYITDGKEHRVTIYSTKGEFLLTFGGPFTQMPGESVAAGGFLVPQGITIDQNDRIYVADQLNGRFQVFQYLNARYLGKFPVLPGQAAVPQPVAK